MTFKIVQLHSLLSLEPVAVREIRYHVIRILKQPYSKRFLWKETEKPPANIHLSDSRILEADPLAPVKPSYDASPGQHLTYPNGRP